MPKSAHRALEKSARKKKLKGNRKDAYIFGTLKKIEDKIKKKRKK